MHEFSYVLIVKQTLTLVSICPLMITCSSPLTINSLGKQWLLLYREHLERVLQTKMEGETNLTTNMTTSVPPPGHRTSSSLTADVASHRSLLQLSHQQHHWKALRQNSVASLQINCRLKLHSVTMCGSREIILHCQR